MFDPPFVLRRLRRCVSQLNVIPSPRHVVVASILVVASAAPSARTATSLCCPASASFLCSLALLPVASPVPQSNGRGRQDSATMSEPALSHGGTRRGDGVTDPLFGSLRPPAVPPPSSCFPTAGHRASSSSSLPSLPAASGRPGEVGDQPVEGLAERCGAVSPRGRAPSSSFLPPDTLAISPRDPIRLHHAIPSFMYLDPSCPPPALILNPPMSRSVLLPPPFPATAASLINIICHGSIRKK